MSCRTRWEGPRATPAEPPIEALLKASIARTNAREKWTIEFPAPSRTVDLGGGKPVPPAPVRGETAEIAIPSVTVSPNDIAAVLSPSQCNSYLDCSARWYYKYVRGLPAPASGSQVRGRAVHSLVGYWFRERLAGRTPDNDTLAEAYHEIWDTETADAEFTAKDDIEALKTSGAVLAQKYLAEVGHKITPAATELKVAGTIGGVQVRGFVDLLCRDDSGKIIDLKTSGRTPSGVSADHALQLATYARLTPEASGLVQIDTVVATKTPKLHSIEYRVSDADNELIDRLYPAVQQSMREGFHLPNRGSHFCSRRHCAHVDECVKEFGGEVF